MFARCGVDAVFARLNVIFFGFYFYVGLRFISPFYSFLPIYLFVPFSLFRLFSGWITMPSNLCLDGLIDVYFCFYFLPPLSFHFYLRYLFVM